MKLNLEVNILDKSPIKSDFIEKIVENSLKATLGERADNKKISLSFAVVPEKEIKKYNRIYRKKNEPTDILTFCEYEKVNQLEKNLAVEKEIFLGEALLCYNDIKKYCQKNKKNLSMELASVISHGVLHLLGFKHSKKMRIMQESIVQKIMQEKTKK